MTTDERSSYAAGVAIPTNLAASPAVRVVVRPLGNPLPLGFLALMVATTGDDVHHRTMLPVGRRGAGADTMTGDPEAELASLVHEAGVRKQL